ncbi:hypothetical protein AWV80_38625 [Cupriavidus sp. UYMU48A]|nr:hypothetical protein AWV80_38625 [Cupriavidus sp. UYMU48A]
MAAWFIACWIRGGQNGNSASFEAEQLVESAGASVQTDGERVWRAKCTQQRANHRATLLQARTADAIVDQVQSAVGDYSAVDKS